MSNLILDWELIFEPNITLSKISVVRFNELYLINFITLFELDVIYSKFDMLRFFDRKLVAFLY